MCWSYIILSQLWRLFINTNQFPLHLAKSHALALVLMHAPYTNKEIWTHTTCGERTCTPQIKKQTHLAGCPTKGLRIDLHTQTKRLNTHPGNIRSSTKHTNVCALPTHSEHKHTQTNKCTRTYTSTYSLTCTHTAINREAGLWWGRESACSAHTGRICNFLQLSLY